jgi:hypothetical protein
MSARIKDTLFRLLRVEPRSDPGLRVLPEISYPTARGKRFDEVHRILELPSYRKLLAEFVLANSAEVVARSAYWKEVFPEPVGTHVQRLKKQGMLVEPNNPRARMCHDRDESDLRIICLDLGLAPTGGVNELADRLLTIDPTGWLLGYAGELLQCSESAAQTLDKPQEADTPLSEPDLAGLFTRGDFDTQRCLLNSRLQRDASDDEVIWEMLKARAQQDAHEGNLAQCRNVYLQMANHLVRRDKKRKALQALFVVCVFDLCGARDRGNVPQEMRPTYSRFDADKASLPSSLAGRVRILSRELNLSMDELREFFLGIATQLKVPRDPRKLWVVLQLALEGALETADEVGDLIIPTLLE